MTRARVTNLALSLQRDAGGPADPARAAQLLEAACGEGVGQSCARLGSMFEQGQGVEEDLARAVQIYTEACQAGTRLPA